MHQKPNHCIACTVKQCSHHCGEENYCALDRVSIGTHESDPTMTECVDCMSFIKR